MTIPTISTLPTAPARTDPPATFVTRADSFLAALVTMQSELNTSIGAMNTDIAGVNADAVSAAADAVSAAASAAAAEAASNATEWVSGTSYDEGDVVYSPIDFKSYRANTATSGTTDPSASADWTVLGYALPTQTGNSGKFLTTDGTDESWADVDALPDQSGNADKYLTTDGSIASWADVGGGIDIQCFGSSGTWNKPANASLVYAEVWGAGSGGGTGNALGSACCWGGAGGGGGAYRWRMYPAAFLGSTESVTVGAGGVGRTSYNQEPTSGGNSCFSCLVAYGGRGKEGGGWSEGSGPQLETYLFCNRWDLRNNKIATIAGTTKQMSNTFCGCYAACGNGSPGTFGGGSGSASSICATRANICWHHGGNSYFGGGGGGGGGLVCFGTAGALGGGPLDKRTGCQSNYCTENGTGGVVSYQGCCAQACNNGCNGDFLEGGGGGGGQTCYNNLVQKSGDGGNGGCAGGGGAGGSHANSLCVGNGGNGGNGFVKVYSW